MRRVKSGGGWAAIAYTLSKARQAGGFWKLWKAMRTKNACKTCALGMGGQRGGMVNESGHFPEVCKKSMQAMVADMQGAITADFWRRMPVESLQRLTPRELEACGRLVEPLLYTPDTGRYMPITWDDALQRVVDKLRATPADRTFWYFSGRSSNEAGFLLQLFARMYGTNNVNNCSYYCHQASGVGLSRTTGSGTATVVLDDVEHADLVLVIGGNPASNHPRLMRTLMQVRRRGGHVIVINPVVETGLVNFRVPSDVRSLLFGTEIASLYVQPHIGGDLALLYGVAKHIDEQGACNEDFLSQHCVGWPQLRERLRSLDWHEIEQKSGVSRDEIRAIADRYTRANNVVFSWTMGITHHAHGVHNVEAIANLALMRAMVGRKHAGLLPIRGHSNVQGIGSVGVTPKLKDAIFQRLQNHFGVELPTQPGLDTMASMEAAAAGEIDVGFCLGGNLYGSNPDSTFAREALTNLDMLVYLSTTLNTGHAYGLARETIILPVLARDEEPQPTTQESMFNYVRLSDGGPRRLAGPRSEVEVVSHIAQQVLGQPATSADGAVGDDGQPQSPAGASPIDWREMAATRQIRQTIARVVPGFEKIGQIDETKAEFQIGGRTFHEPVFATPDGKAHLHTHDLPELAGGGDQLRLMTVRSEGQFNTVVYEDYDLYRGVERRDVILIHPSDVASLSLAAAQRVRVHGPAGSLENILVVPFENIRPGNVLMYYPEANVLVDRGLDPLSKTPAFKGALVTLQPAGAAVPVGR